MTLDITGRKFGKLTALSVEPQRSSRGELMWKCQCDCGRVTVVRGRKLRTGRTKTCGCTKRTYQHARTKDIPEYCIWVGMIERCNPKNSARYKWHAGRGIKVCERWRRFKNFLFDMGPRPSGNHQTTTVIMNRETVGGLLGHSSNVTHAQIDS
jgi:hypothetical protein